MDEATACAIPMPCGSPVPTYNPSALPTSIMAALARLTMSMGETSNIGTPPTPLPTLGWMGITASAVQAFTKVVALATFHRAEDGRPGLLDQLHLLVRPEAGETGALVLELPVEAEHHLGRHAHLHGHVRGRRDGLGSA
jgi:hypothetical protein